MRTQTLLFIAALLLSVSLEAGEYRVVRSFPVATEPACMPAVTRAPNGDILVAFSTEWEPFPWGGVLKLIRSRDNGQTWSEPRVLWKDKDPRVTIQVANGLQSLSNGDVLLPVTYCLVPKRGEVSPDEKHPIKIYDLSHKGYRREARVLRSKDSGRTWSVEDPRLETPFWRFGRLLETTDSRLIMPRNGAFFESRDFGATWGEKVSLGTPRFSSETNIIEAPDGSFFSIVRSGGEPPRRAFGTNRSVDGGKTWGRPRPAGVQGKMPDLLVTPSGRILLAVGAEGLTDGSLIFKEKSRFSFCTLFISDDSGRSWKRDVALGQVDPGSPIVPGDSPVLCELGEGKILVVMQGIDRREANNPLVGYSAGMSLIGNILEPTVATKIKSSPDVIIYEGTYPGWPWITTAPDGSYLCVFREGTRHGFSAEGRLMITSSTDHGETWSQARVFVDEPAVDDRNVAITALSSGDLLVSYNHFTSSKKSIAMTTRSQDGGATWSDSTPVGVKNTRTRSAAAELRDGALVLPYYISPGRGSLAARSDDGGRSWTTVHVPDADGFVGDEWDLLEVDAGRLIGIHRNNKPGAPGVFWKSESRDGGRTWVAPVPTNVHDAGRTSPATIVLHNGRPTVFYSDRRMVSVSAVTTNDPAFVRWDIERRIPCFRYRADGGAISDAGYPVSVKAGPRRRFVIDYEIRPDSKRVTGYFVDIPTW